MKVSRRTPASNKSCIVQLFCCLLACIASIEALQDACIPVKLNGSNLACRCDAQACDSGLHFNWPLARDEFVRVSSNAAGARFQVTRLSQGENLTEQHIDKVEAVVRVSINEHYQRVLGFGGALTDSAAKLIMELDEPVRARLLDDYFGPAGLDYNLARVPIGGTDMSSRPYTYNDLPPGQASDFQLDQFALQAEDLELKLPLIKRINRLKASRHLGPLKLMAACWSPPAWMKDNAHLVQGNLKMTMQEDMRENPYYASYAQYIVRFLEAYAKQNVTLWALSAQNEPRSPRRLGPGVIHHNSVNFTPEQLVAWYKYHLLPALKKASKFKRLHHFIWDDVYEDMDSYVNVMLNEPAIREAITGVAMHWYSSGIRDMPFSGVERSFNELPYRYSMISTEASYMGGQRPGDWSHGAGYARDLIRTLRTGFIGWLDWNLALDPSGGPTWAQNPLDSAIQVNLTSQSYLKNPMFYALAHVARFVQPNSTIVDSDVIELTGGSAGKQTLHALAAEIWPPPPHNTTTCNSNNSTLANGCELHRRLALVILNMSNSSRLVRLELPECQAKRRFANLQLELPPNSLESLAFIC